MLKNELKVHSYTAHSVIKKGGSDMYSNCIQCCDLHFALKIPSRSGCSRRRKGHESLSMVLNFDVTADNSLHACQRMFVVIKQNYAI
jgi:hypothetical protein